MEQGWIFVCIRAFIEGNEVADKIDKESAKKNIDLKAMPGKKNRILKYQLRFLTEKRAQGKKRGKLYFLQDTVKSEMFSFKEEIKLP